MLLLTHNPTRLAHPAPWNKGKLVGPKLSLGIRFDND